MVDRLPVWGIRDHVIAPPRAGNRWILECGGWVHRGNDDKPLWGMGVRSPGGGNVGPLVPPQGVGSLGK